MSYTSSPQVDLELKPSELPPGCTAPLCARADGRLVENGKVITLRLVRLRAGEFVLYARWDGRNMLALYNRVPQVWKGKPTPQKLYRIAESFQQNICWSFGSIHKVADTQNRRNCIALSRRFDPFRKRKRDYAWLNADLSEPIAFEIEEFPNKTTNENLQIAMNVPNSSAYFASDWQRSSSVERVEIWQSQVEKRAQMEQLMQWVLWCLPETWQQTDKIRLCSTRAYRPDEWFYLAPSYPFRSPQLSASAAEFALKWGQLWQIQFLPIHALSLQEHNYQLYKLGFSMPNHGATVHAPTAHEQLEARLNLRDWLQRNAPQHLNELTPA